KEPFDSIRETSGYTDNNESISSTCSSASAPTSQEGSRQQHQRRKMRPMEDANDSVILDEEEHPLLSANNCAETGDKQAISFLTALKIPGVIEFSLCLFFAKLVSYTFLYWLPKYIGQSTDSSSS
ncbi:unnamed protein product, partial [Medioppia subpectinata]